MDLLSAALSNPINRKILERLPLLGLADCWLVAGCLFQSLWNHMSGRPVRADIKDYDIFYFDGSDLSYGAEDRAIKMAEQLFSDLGVLVELRNQARVHLWYPQKFGAEYPPLGRATDGIDRFLVAGTCVGVQSSGDGAIKLHATFGTHDAEAGILRPNPKAFGLSRFMDKALSYRQRWDWLRIEDADASEFDGGASRT